MIEETESGAKRTGLMRLHHHLYSHFYIKMTVVMLLSILIYPSIEQLDAALAAIIMVDVAMMLMAMNNVAFESRRRGVRRFLLVLFGVSAVTLDVYTALHPNPDVILATSLFFCLFYIYAIYNMMRYVLLPGRITLDRLFASLTVYMTLALFWAVIYRIIFILDPKAFRFDGEFDRDSLSIYDFIYFSYATITTTGYGDIVPNTHQVQSFAIVEQMVGVLYVAILVARLTNLYSSHAQAPD
ncbi:potassium channel family protein [Aquabacter spiritensis]|uniref:Ion channel n=1 Tax=Aquabacter spiritensis TaxID=933073 RepID=A0A4R3M5F8_9HYPH|nr:potassium channel family protein [Aquabacter spiritensis]TCT07823.1 ion channel [Aquabacter spiritensis]